MTPDRPLLRFHGSKFLMREWILAHFPPHEVYVEAFGGAAAVLLGKPRVGPEIYNDLDQSLVNVFRVLQDPRRAELLRRRLELTPFARSEFDRTYEFPTDEIDWAWKTIARSQMGHGTDSITRTCRTGFRSKLTASRALPSETWARWPAAVPAFVDRLKGVVIECREATEVMLRFDRPSTLFYVDPPYVHDTRSSLRTRSRATHGYRHELSDPDHRRLSKTLHKLEGMVVLSGYPSALYDDLYGDWQYEETETLADTAKVRVERLWFNPLAWERSHAQPRLPMWEEAKTA